MKHLFDPSDAVEMKTRIITMSPDSAKQWGKMDVAQIRVVDLRDFSKEKETPGSSPSPVRRIKKLQ